MTISETMRKITISLPEELVTYADDRAKELNTSRSQVIGMALSQVKTDEDLRLAAEGYRFYAQEAREFAEASGHTVAESWADTWQAADDEGADDAGQAR